MINLKIEKYTFGNAVSEIGILYVTPFGFDDVSHLGYHIVSVGRHAVIFRQI
jgi:hypothetical protein